MNRPSLCLTRGLPLPVSGVLLSPAEAQGASRGYPQSWRSGFRASSILPIVLAGAVVLWGLAYKISLYHPPQNHGGRTNVAKLWTGPQKASLQLKLVRFRESSAIPSQMLALTAGHSAQNDIGLFPLRVWVCDRSHCRMGMLRSPPLQILSLGRR